MYNINLPNKHSLESNITFTKSQEQALEKLNDFVKSDKLICSLIGAAGTGKTFILKYFLNTYNKASCVTAPTHKAVRVVEKATGKKGMTFHSLHGLRPNVDVLKFDINNPNFEPMSEPKMPEYALIVVDECSQIPKALATLNETRAKIYNVKILYVGDKYQLPPPKESISVTFTHNNIIELTEIVRQEDTNPLLPMFTMLRKDIDYGTSNFLTELYKNKVNIVDKEGYIFLGKDDYLALLKRKFEEDKLHSRFLSWKVDTVNENSYNIRQFINGDINILNNNDVLTAYNTVHDEFLTPILLNSIDYTVNKLDNRTNDLGLNVYNIQFKSEFNELSTSIQVINHRDIDSLNRYTNILDNLHHEAYTASFGTRAKKWKAFFTFKNSILSMVNIPIKSSKNPIQKDFTYSYGLTIHKSQGSTYNNVFLDLNDLLFYKNGTVVKNTPFNKTAIELQNKLLYVAFTRTNRAVYIKNK